MFSLFRWRRGCATDGHEMTDNSEAQPKQLTGDLGCSSAGSRDEGLLTVRHTLCLCNSTLCNEERSMSPAFVPSFVIMVILPFIISMVY